MCYLCLKNNDFSIDHLNKEIKKLQYQEMLEKSKEVKRNIRAIQIQLQSERSDGFETKLLNKRLEELKQMQYLFSQKM